MSHSIISIIVLLSTMLDTKPSFIILSYIDMLLKCCQWLMNLSTGITPDDDNLLFLLNGGKSRSITPPPSDPTSSSTLDSRVPDAAKLEEEVRVRDKGGKR